MTWDRYAFLVLIVGIAYFVNPILSLACCVLICAMGGPGYIVALAFLGCASNNLVGMHVPYNYLFLTIVYAMFFFTVKSPGILKEYGKLIVLYVIVQFYGFAIGIKNISDLPEDEMIQVYGSLVFSIGLFIMGLDLGRYVAKFYKDMPFLLVPAVAVVLVAVLFKMLFGPYFLLPAEQIFSFESKKQLVGGGSVEVGRVFGSFLGPNALALFSVFCILFLMPSIRSINTKIMIAVLVIVAFMTFSKSSVITLLIVFLVFSVLGLKGPKRAVILLAGSLAILSGFMNWEFIQEAFRIDISRSESTTRSVVYGHMISGFPLENYLIGIGQYSWRDYFESSLGISIQDPHSVLFSVPGGYGFMGVLFYLFFTYQIIKNIKGSDNAKCVLLLALLAITYFKDLFSIPEPLGSSPFTMLYWMLYSFSLNLQSNIRPMHRSSFT